MQELIKLRDTFREIANIIDEMLALKAREDSGEDIKQESESILGRYMIKLAELNQLQG